MRGGHSWRGTPYDLDYGDVELELTDDVQVWRWPAIVAFSTARLPYPLLGQCGCLEFLDAKFLDVARRVELDPNSAYPGTVN